MAFDAAYRSADMNVSDLDFAEVHDCFTIAELLIYEAMGLTEPGKGRAAIDEGWTEAEGKLPINLSGGLKAKGHPVGATGVSMHVLGFLQLTGQAGEMQKPGVSIGACCNMGGSLVTSYVSILETINA